jgi:PPK2 family polyphosphate:nucleotide phosphotransferase
MDVERYRISPNDSVDLDAWDPRDTDGFDGNKASAQAELATLNERLAELQALLFAEGKHKVLIVLQGMDTSGKDGTIKHVFRTINPLGVHVANFKRPNDVELSHDYLWRVHRRTPENGRLTIFNRSHYEDVLITRVHGLISTKTCRRRYQHILDFERMLAEEGTVIRKFFLNISRAEQKERLEERLRNPHKQWKFEHGDIAERAHWQDYRSAYQDAMAATSTDHAPWYVVPADRKWFRNLVVSQAIIELLEGLKMRYPEPMEGLDRITIED